jgi:hypothetical protein
VSAQRLLAAGAFALLAAACAGDGVDRAARDVRPLSHRPLASGLERSVGLLRRLVLLPVRLDFSPQDPGWCMDPCDAEALRAGIAESVRHELGDRRGYELAPLEPSGALDADVAALASFAAERPDAAPPSALAARVRELASAAHADGVVIVHGRATTLTWLDGAAWLATFSLAIPVSMARIGTRLEADVFEAASGRLVWASRIRSWGAPGTERTPLARSLFDPIEPALPAVLSVPLDAPR